MRRIYSFWFVVLFSISAVAQQNSDEKVRLRRADLAKLPTHGTASLVVRDELVFVDLGERFLGSAIRGKLVVTNKTRRPFEILDIRSSCGCTTAYAADRNVDHGESTEILVNAAISKPGKSGVRITLDTDMGRFPIALVVLMKPRVTLSPSVFNLKQGEEKLTGSFVCHDSEILVKNVSVVFNGDALEPVRRGNELHFVTKAPSSDNKSEVLNFSLWEGRTEIATVTAILNRVVEFELVNTTVYAQRKGSQDVFRLIARGEVLKSFEPSAALISIDGSQVAAKVESAMKTQFCIFTVRIPSRELQDTPAEIAIGSHSCKFTLNHR
ncbi:DUF1573 domain-containing protein [Rhodopirellula sp. JC639]|uniref:DUF1573 domain-containing protein n=1 Tax=Stieleria mannarensis TaxID=2755585 RepID=UPI001603690F|nr:DUF1573 domain-containing protein [Rhodopirellula sp. JC639]